jgi:hypothetical protein
MLLVTKVNGRPYFRRTTIEWDGVQFTGTIEGQVINKTDTDVEYSGACRAFMNHTESGGKYFPATVQHTVAEQIRIDEIGTRKQAAKTVKELADAAWSYEIVLNDIDVDYEKDHAVIAPPYAFAEWDEGNAGWTVRLNPECKSPDVAKR